jgi:GTP cyclohydrolase I
MTDKIYANGNKVLTDAEKTDKKAKLKELFSQMFDILEMDTINDPNIQDTPSRMAKMYVDELLEGCFNEAPKITTFPNQKKFDELIISGPIKLDSLCSHHFITISGQAFIGYIPGDKVIGISKFSRIVRYFSRRPQIQEELTQQIADYIEELMQPKGLIVVLKARHYCEIARGVREENIYMQTSSVKGVFKDNPAARKEFFDLISINK